MASVDELRRNLKSVGKDPDPHLVSAVQQVLAPVRNKSWSIPGQGATEEEYPVE